MLSRLEISNYALIENVSLKLENGFTVITGETGAGKSILLKALSLLLGGRADTAVLKQSEKKCFLEAEFNISKLSLKSFFEQYELDYDDQCIIRREFTPSGKSRGFINDTPVQMTQLKELGDQLIAIHSQHQTLELFNGEFQMDVLDAFAGIQEEVIDYAIGYKIYRQKVNEHIELKVKDMENRKEKDYLSFLINELKLADLDNTDLEELQSKSDNVENFEAISSQLGLAQSVFENDTYGPHVAIKTLLEAFEELKKFNPKYSELHARILSLKIEMDDLSAEVGNQDAGADMNPSEAEAIKEKMELLNSLIFKHNLTEVTELKTLLEKLEGQMSEIDSLEESMNALAAEIETIKASLTKQANGISTKRIAAAPNLCENVSSALDQLAMENAELQIGFQKLDRLNAYGLDEIEFEFKANKGGSFQPIKKVASGGELSRLMLTILSLLSAHKNLPTLIFDEIDTGVSGEVASKIANEFVQMGQKIQLISITHLPQIAAKGQNHFHVSKHTEADKTITTVLQLDGDNRVNELAKMISGEEVTAAARENALHLLNIS